MTTAEEEAIRVIKSGGIIIYPTETVYGIGGSILDERVIKKIFEIKGRSSSMPISAAVSSFEMIEEIGLIDEDERTLIEELLPGPVTVLVKKSSSVPDILTSGSPLLGIRFPDHHMALKIIEATGPITSTSANKSGAPSPSSAAEIDWDIAKAVDLVVDGGQSRYRESSTLVDLKARKVIRPGAGLDKVLKAIA
jgi:L-threonylcarbamoyladenylate synthase